MLIVYPIRFVFYVKNFLFKGLIMKIGVIADDFTGATDIASFFVANGLSTVQLCKVESKTECPKDVDVIVISHKTRSCPVDEALTEVSKTLSWLKANNCPQIFFKYCSTFDSTTKGNIGPVTDFLMEQLNCKFTIFSPALPINGRTVYQGYLFVEDVLLSQSGMRNHPVTPMTESNIVNLVHDQSKYKCGLINSQILDEGPESVKSKMQDLIKKGYRYAVVDAINTKHLITQAKAFKDLPLLTGGSGLAIGISQVINSNYIGNIAYKYGTPNQGRGVVLSGSCSVMTNKQVAFYKQKASSKKVDIKELMKYQNNIEQLVDTYYDFILTHINEPLAPLVYATDDGDSLKKVLKNYGNEVSSNIEKLFFNLAKKLKVNGVNKFIVAGGETSGTITQALDINGFYIGPSISPGVPWVKSLDGQVSLTLKSGNFGQEDFFERAQKDY